MQRKGTRPNLNKLLEWEFAVHVLVHLAEDLVRPLLWRRLILWHFHNRPNLEEWDYKWEEGVATWRRGCRLCGDDMCTRHLPFRLAVWQMQLGKYRQVGSLNALQVSYIWGGANAFYSSANSIGNYLASACCHDVNSFKSYSGDKGYKVLQLLLNFRSRC